MVNFNKSILFLLARPCDYRDYNRFGVEYFVAKGWAVEVWDLSAIFSPKAYSHFYYSGGRAAQFGGYYEINNYRALFERIFTIRGFSYYCDFSGCTWGIAAVKFLLRLIGVRRIVVLQGALPFMGKVDVSGYALKLLACFKGAPLDSIGRFMRKMRHLFCDLFPPELRVLAGNANYGKYVRAKNTLAAHGFDYDSMLSDKAFSGSSDKPYAVFLDQSVVGHSDKHVLGAAEPSRYLQSLEYYPVVNEFLSSISARYGLEIFIAMHPRTHGRIPGQCFYSDDFQVRYGQAVSLVNRASIVFCHNSASLQYAVLMKKPIFFVTTTEWDRRQIFNYPLNQLAFELGQMLVYIDTPASQSILDEWPEVCDEKYCVFIRNYIKCDMKDKRRLWQIVIEYLEKVGSS